MNKYFLVLCLCLFSLSGSIHAQNFVSALSIDGRALGGGLPYAGDGDLASRVEPLSRLGSSLLGVDEISSVVNGIALPVAESAVPVLTVLMNNPGEVGDYFSNGGVILIPAITLVPAIPLVNEPL
ncbi:hypothetical protein HNQ57_003299 [Zhongshania antarctica]|uniref:Uncharacterized protein n=1 Tax=Zhongshania antarctica TaxID=641702 RepID=A0A840R9I1_9GAMM|nr:hypothetical protein [Zhongshania antarctica]MBB5189000.1 hypothetical protein [Zhongshania antarctica]